MRVTLYLLLLTISFCCFSCQKEIGTEVSTPIDNNNDSTNNSNSIIGTWKFVSVEAKTQNSSELKIANGNEKILAFLDYLSQENDGTIVIDSIGLNCTGITYKILSRVKAYRYKNDILADSFNLPFTSTFLQTSSYTTYEINADSIFFKKGGFANIAASRLRVSASTAKIELKDSLLLFTQQLYKDSIQNISGIKSHIVQKGTAVITMKRTR